MKTRYKVYFNKKYIDNMMEVPTYIVEYTSGDKPKRFEEYNGRGLYVQHNVKMQMGDSIAPIPDEQFDEILEDYKKMSNFMYVESIIINKMHIDQLTHPVKLMRNMGIATIFAQ